MDLNLKVLLICLLTFHTYSQEVQSIDLNYVYNYTLQPMVHKKLKVTMPDKLQKEQNLFISAQSPFNDPYQIPYMNISSDDDAYFQQCFEKDYDYSDICEIKNQDLKPGQTYNIDIYCIIQCKIKLSAYTSNNINLDFDTQYRINSYDYFGVSQTLQLTVPQKIFTEISLVLTINNLEQIDEQVSMYANYGANITLPDSLRFDQKAKSSFNHILIITIDSYELSQGDKILVLINVPPSAKLSFVATISENNKYNLNLNEGRVEVCSYQNPKTYTLDLSQINQLKPQDIISITLIVYSGNPTVVVSFDPQFPQDKLISNNYIERSMGFILTDQIRRQMGFSGKVYIKVTSIWSSNYLIKANLQQNNFISVQNDIIQIVQLGPMEIKNFIFEDINFDDSNNSNAQISINYRIKIKMLSGTAQGGLKLCKSLQQNNTLECLILTKQQMESNETQQAFSQIQHEIQQKQNIYEIYYNYDVSLCPKYTLKSNGLAYVCDYQLIFQNKGEQKNVQIGVEWQKRVFSKKLQEGEPFKDTVDKQQYNYYSFTLINASQVQSLDFSVTTIEGDTSLIVSKTSYYPTLDQGFTGNADFSIFNYISYNNNQLTQGRYYISVYGYDASDYSITAIVKRKNQDENNDDKGSNQNNGKITEISLTNGETQKFSLKTTEKDQNLYFSFKATDEKNTKIQVNQIKGVVNYQVFEKDNSNQICNSKNFSNSKQNCQFTSIKDTTYLINLEALKSQNPDGSLIFTIIYWTEEQCITYTTEVPFFVTVKPKQSICYTFNKANDDDIEMTFSMTAFELLTSDLYIKAVFPLKQIQIKDHQKIIPADQFALLCNEDDKNFKKCEFKLVITNKDDNITSSLYGAVQTGKKQIILFGGIPETIISKNMSQNQPKRFYYFLNYVNEDGSYDDLMIALSSKTEATYQIGATIVKSKDYAKDYQNKLYPSLNSQNPKHKTIDSYSFTPITILKFNPQEFIVKQQDDDLYVLLIAVYPLQYFKNDDQVYIFEIQTTQRKTILPFGSSKIGYVQKDQIYEFQIRPDPKTSSIIDIRSLSSQTCFKSYQTIYGDQMTDEFNQVKIFDNEKDIKTILIKGISDQICTFQIGFSSLKDSVMTVVRQIPYNVFINEDNMTKYFLYEHNHNETFQILAIIYGGKAQIFATPYDNKKQFSELLDKNIQRFQYKGQGINDALRIQSDSESFCFNCQYFIAVRGAPQVDMELYVTLNSSPIPLMEGTFTKDNVAMQQIKTYQFYSLSKFNVTLKLLYGKAKIIIKNPSGQQIINQQVKSEHEFVIPSPKTSDEDSYQYFGQSSRYQISIEGQQTAGYYISIKRKDIERKIPEGLPVSLNLGKQRKQIITFDSLSSQEGLYVLIQNLNYTSNSQPINIKFDATAQNQKQSQNDMIANINNIQGSYNLQLKPFSGTFQLSITSDQFIEVEIIVAKKQFTHLIASRSTLVKHEGIFEIFSPGDSIMFEMFVCEGKISVTASSNISKLLHTQQNDEGLVHMQQANYGGHYVVTARNLTGEYFIKINKQDNSKDQILYLVSYYLFDSSKQDIPYKNFKILSLDINYKYHQGSTQFLLSPVQNKSNRDINSAITYKLYISQNIQDINNITKCSIGQAYTLTQETGQQSLTKDDDFISFSVQNSKLRELIKSGDSFYVGAEAVVQISDAQQQHIKAAYYVYEISQLLLNNSPDFHSQKNQNLKFVLLWIVIPFLFGSILLYLAARYCIRSLSAYPTQLVQQDDIGPSEDALHNNNNNQ